MDAEVAEAAMKFMLRVPLKGEEVPAFNVVMNALNRIVENAREGQQQPSVVKAEAIEEAKPAA